jgi:vacuolar-type H+-ATPase subunit I/STV1
MDSIGPSSSRQKLSERIEMISPVQQVVDQAKSEINRIKYRNKTKIQTKDSKQPRKRQRKNINKSEFKSKSTIKQKKDILGH